MSGPVSNLSPRIRYSLGDPRFVVILAGAIILLVLPLAGHFLDQSFLTSFVAKMMIFAIAAASLDLILGYGGMVSFGHAAYIGLGGYAVGIFSKYAVDFDIAWMQSGFIHFPAAIVGSALVALLIGAICLRTSGLYFIMITLAFTQMLYFLGISLEPFGGDDGMNVDRSEFYLPKAIFGDGVGFSLNDNLVAPADGDRDLMLIYYVTFLCLAVSLFVLRRFVNSRFGMVVRGSYSNPVRMEAVGFPTYRYRLTAFVIAGGVCGLAGALFANHQEFMTPEYMHWFRSGEILIMVIMGGMGTIFGPVAGAIAFLTLEEVLQGIVGVNYWMLVFGPLLIFLVLFAKRGLFGLIPDRAEGLPRFLAGTLLFVVCAAAFILLLSVVHPLTVVTVGLLTLSLIRLTQAELAQPLRVTLLAVSVTVVFALMYSSKGPLVAVLTVAVSAAITALAAAAAAGRLKLPGSAKGAAANV